ncbi:fluoride efflux transporter CrcB [Undibacterium rugosum]|uniref:Fluoride-specific ion channel FluC n=1 Tax=Undibacterium rugosum TaxID=2762291 RepID=A0A923KZ62_9BURK|nr:fluoride efflux transporter CrcB [Undibacterium rugosum]MBC3935493.1 fluoride efflux transporter CrcB [Undibacterium rugosum]MBR7778893.1 fluoride efflux transporter CrcB [Undibacterium rugosum]
MNALGILAVGIGAAFGAWLRWLLALWGNQVWAQVPLGTLIANLGGGYLIGLAVAFFSGYPDLSPAWRLFVITGFLGGLTTFSTFSAESMQLLQKGEVFWALAHAGLHLLGSVLCCFAGFLSYRALTS